MQAKADLSVARGDLALCLGITGVVGIMGVHWFWQLDWGWGRCPAWISMGLAHGRVWNQAEPRAFRHGPVYLHWL